MWTARPAESPRRRDGVNSPGIGARPQGWAPSKSRDGLRSHHCSPGSRRVVRESGRVGYAHSKDGDPQRWTAPGPTWIQPTRPHAGTLWRSHVQTVVEALDSSEARGHLETRWRPCEREPVWRPARMPLPRRRQRRFETERECPRLSTCARNVTATERRSTTHPQRLSGLGAKTRAAKPHSRPRAFT